MSVSQQPQRPAGVRPIGAPGHMGVDYEERVDFARLRDYRVNRATQALRASECGAFLEFLNDSVLGSTFSRYKSPALVNLDFHPTFTNVLLRKDLQLGLSAGKELGVPMPLAAAADMLIAQAIGAGYTADDFATLVLEQVTTPVPWLRSLAGIEPLPPVIV